MLLCSKHLAFPRPKISEPARGSREFWNCISSDSLHTAAARCHRHALGPDEERSAPAALTHSPPIRPGGVLFCLRRCPDGFLRRSISRNVCQCLLQAPSPCTFPFRHLLRSEVLIVGAATICRMFHLRKKRDTGTGMPARLRNSASLRFFSCGQLHGTRPRDLSAAGLPR
jgi:hypothetical protein